MLKLILGSVTNAMKAKRALQAIGLHPFVTKVSTETTGCIYVIEIERNHQFAAFAALREKGISYTVEV